MNAASRPRSVAFVASQLAFGGAERVLVEQVRALEPWGVPVDVWISKAARFEQIAPELVASHRFVRDVRVVRGTNRLLARLLWRRPDVVVSYSAPRAYRALIRARRIPFVRRPAVLETIHERYAWSLSSHDATRPRAVDAYALTYDFREQARRAFGVGNERLFVARPLFESSLLEIGERDRDEARHLRRLWGVSADGIVIGYLGRLGDNKGLLDVIELVRGLASKGRDVHLVLAGRTCPELGDFDARLAAAIGAADAASDRCRGRFHLAGVVARRESVYAAFDVLALASRSEGLLPLMLVEGLSAGLAVVTTGVGGIAESLRDGVDAEVVAKVPDDERDLAPDVRAQFEARLTRLVDDRDRRLALGASGRERVRSLVRANDFHEATRRAIEGVLALRRTTRAR